MVSKDFDGTEGPEVGFGPPSVQDLGLCHRTSKTSVGFKCPADFVGIWRLCLPNHPLPNLASSTVATSYHSPVGRDLHLMHN